jgi:glyoxylase-like metal-dependent hydrolase (beta-lactamase superfamily II)
MEELADGVWHLKGRPNWLINVYLAGDVVIDAATKHSAGLILGQVEGREISELALTHVHPDHQGAAKEICEVRGIPLACHEDDVDAMEGRRPVMEANQKHPLNMLYHRILEGPPRKVDRIFTEGDEVAGFRVIHAPGHARGQAIFFRDSDRVAICGDVVENMNSALGFPPGLHEPPRTFTLDAEGNRRSIRKLAALEPRLILSGHGKPVRDMAKFQRWVEKLPE